MHLGARASPHPAASAEHCEAVTQTVQLAHLVTAEQHRHAVPRERLRQPPHVTSTGWVQPCCRLVQQQQSGRAHQRRRDAQSLAHPGGVAGHAIARPINELDLGKRLVDAGTCIRFIQLGQHLQVRPPRQIRIEARILDEAGHSSVAVSVDGACLPEQRHLAGVGAHKSEQDLKRVVFPAPLGPSRPLISPSATVTSTSSRARISPYRLLKPLAISAAMAARV